MNKGRKRIELTPLEINKANLMYYVNDRNLTAIARPLERSVPVIDRHIFKTRQEYYDWYEEMVSEGKL
jgi:hypothetical protein